MDTPKWSAWSAAAVRCPRGGAAAGQRSRGSPVLADVDGHGELAMVERRHLPCGAERRFRARSHAAAEHNPSRADRSHLRGSWMASRKVIVIISRIQDRRADDCGFGLTMVIGLST